MTKKKILVTGANGQLGKELQQLAHSRGGYEFVFLTREELPINDFENLKNYFGKYYPQYCINCAAYTAVDNAESEHALTFQVNADAVGMMATACGEIGCQFIHISTDYVFDGKATRPYKEDSPTAPQGVYGASKLEGERLALQSNPGTVIIRTSWVYSEFGKNFVKTMLRLMNEKPEINVVSDQIGSPTYAADLAEAIMQIIGRLNDPVSQLSYGGIYNYSNSGVISWYEFAVAIKQLTGSRCKVNPISTSQYPTPAKRPAYSVLDKERIRESFGVEIKDWKHSLEVCIGRINAAAS